jgi:hypothetical protein
VVGFGSTVSYGSGETVRGNDRSDDPVELPNSEWNWTSSPPGLKPSIDIPSVLAGFKTRFPGLKVRGWHNGEFPQPVKPSVFSIYGPTNVVP